MWNRDKRVPWFVLAVSVLLIPLGVFACNCGDDDDDNDTMPDDDASPDDDDDASPDDDDTSPDDDDDSPDDDDASPDDDDDDDDDDVIAEGWYGVVVSDVIFTGTDADLELGADGILRAAFNKPDNTVVFALIENGAFSEEVISDFEFTKYGSLDLALSASDVPAVVTCTESAELWLHRRDEAVWESTYLTNDCGAQLSAQWRPADDIYVFFSQSTEPYRLVYGVATDGGWAESAPFPQFDHVAIGDSFVDAEGRSTVFFNAVASADPFGGLFLLTDASGIWANSVVRFPPFNDWYLDGPGSQVLDSSGIFRVVSGEWNQYENGETLSYATSADSYSSFELITEAASNAILALGSDDSLHGVFSPNDEWALVYFEGPPGAWATTVVDPARSLEDAIVVDLDGYVHVLYTRVDPREFRYVTNRPIE
jgi:hypothetical protein